MPTGESGSPLLPSSPFPVLRQLPHGHPLRIPLFPPNFYKAVQFPLIDASNRDAVSPLSRGIFASGFICFVWFTSLPSPFDHRTNPLFSIPSYHHFDQGCDRPFRRRPGGRRRGCGQVVGRLLSMSSHVTILPPVSSGSKPSPGNNWPHRAARGLGPPLLF